MRVTVKKWRRILAEKGSGNVVTKTINVLPFTQLHLYTNCNVELIQSDEEKVVIEMDDNLIDCINVDNSTHALYVNSKKRIHMPTFTKGKITIYFRQLEAIYMTTHGDVATCSTINSAQPFLLKMVCHGDSMFDVTAPEMKVNATNHGDFSLRFRGKKLEVNNISNGYFSFNVEAEQVELAQGGHGDLFLSGSGSSLNVTNSGHGDVNAETFHAARITLLSCGHGDTIVNASNYLAIHALGHGAVIYLGTPTVRLVSHSGHGKIVHK
jgi:hypothetical protein